MTPIVDVLWDCSNGCQRARRAGADRARPTFSYCYCVNLGDGTQPQRKADHAHSSTRRRSPMGGVPCTGRRDADEREQRARRARGDMGLADQAARWQNESRGADRGCPRQLLRDGARARPRRRGRTARAVGRNSRMQPRRGRWRTADHQRRPVSSRSGARTRRWEVRANGRPGGRPLPGVQCAPWQREDQRQARARGRPGAGLPLGVAVRDRAQPSVSHQLLIEPSAPFRLDLTVWALRRRSHNAIDRWDASGAYRRVVLVDGRPVWLSVTQDGGAMAPRLSVVLSGGPFDAREGELARSAVDRLLGLSVDLSAFATMALTDPLVGPLAERMRGLKPPRFPTVFEALVNGVACQQLSLTVGIHLLNRLAAAHGRAAADGPANARAFPDPVALA